MASITVNQSGAIIIQTDNSSQPSVVNNYKDGKVLYGESHVTLVLDTRSWRFSDWETSTYGALTSVNGVNVSSFDNVDIAALIASNVLTQDRFSGNQTVIDGTTMVEKDFTAIHIDEPAILNVTPLTGTIMVDGTGAAIDISGWGGVEFVAGDVIYGKFTQVQLVSGTVTCYSAL